MRSRIIRFSASAVGLLLVTSCSPTIPSQRPTTQDKIAAYEQLHFKPRFDELMTGQHTPVSPAYSRYVENKKPDVGEPVIVQGRVVASRQNLNGAGQQVLISNDRGIYRVAEPPTGQRLAALLGDEVVLQGRVAAKEGDTTVVDAQQIQLVR